MHSFLSDIYFTDIASAMPFLSYLFTVCVPGCNKIWMEKGVYSGI